MCGHKCSANFTKNVIIQGDEWDGNFPNILSKMDNNFPIEKFIESFIRRPG